MPSKETIEKYVLIKSKQAYVCLLFIRTFCSELYFILCSTEEFLALFYKPYVPKRILFLVLSI